jgi:hypothetical protein
MKQAALFGQEDKGDDDRSTTTESHSGLESYGRPQSQAKTA